MDKDKRDDFDKSDAEQAAPEVDPDSGTDAEGTPVENPSG